MEALMNIPQLQTIVGQTRRDTSAGVSPFLWRTWKLISDASTDDVVAWANDGRSFIIKDVDAFPALLPKTHGFLKSDFLGFLRELNIHAGAECVGLNDAGVPNEFLVPGFEKGRPELLKTVQRKANFGRYRRVEPLR